MESRPTMGKDDERTAASDEADKTRFTLERRVPPYPIHPVDAEALRFTYGWHRIEPIQQAMCYHGINMGEMAEFWIYADIVPILFAHEQRREL